MEKMDKNIASLVNSIKVTFILGENVRLKSILCIRFPHSDPDRYEKANHVEVWYQIFKTL